MRLRSRDLTQVYLRAHGSTILYGDAETVFGEAREVKMNLQPAHKPAEVVEYGLKPAEAMVAYTTDADIKVLDGVCIDVEATADPNYQVAAALKWPSYTKLILRKRL